MRSANYFNFMKKIFFLLFLGIVASVFSQAPSQPSSFHISAQDRQAICEREYYEAVDKPKEEAKCKGESYNEPPLFSWDAHGFAYLGKTPFIWYPEMPMEQKKFVEDMSHYRDYLQSIGLEMPSLGAGPCPWHSKEDLDLDLANLKKSDDEIGNTDQITRKHQLSDLIDFLNKKEVVMAGYQSFCNRLENAINPDFRATEPDGESSMIGEFPPGRIEVIQANFNALVAFKDEAGNPVGLYALNNFCYWKGDGTAIPEHSNAQAWGLGEVLFKMNEVRSDMATINDYIERLHLKDQDPTIDPNNLSALELFVITAAKDLDTLIENNTIERDRIKGTPGYADFIARYGLPNDERTPEQEKAYQKAAKAAFGLPFYNADHTRRIFYAHVLDYLSWPSNR